MTANQLQTLGWICVVTVALTSCADANARVTPISDTPATQSVSWESVFGEREIDLSHLLVDHPLQRVGRAAANNDGSFFVSDATNKSILRVDSLGVLLKEIRYRVDSTKPEILGSFAVDQRENLYAYSPLSHRIIRFAAPGYAPGRQIEIRDRISDFVVADDGSIFIYHPEDPDGAFKRLDSTGTRNAAARPIADEALRRFHGRTQNGGIGPTAAGGIIAIEPSRFDLIEFDRNLRIVRTGRNSSAGPWTPDAPPFPAELNPNDYSKAHRAWWDSFVHIDRVFMLEHGAVLATVYKSQGLYKAESFANLYDSSLRTIASGMRIPHEGRIVAVRGNKVLVARSAHLERGDSLSAFRLFSYVVRDSVAKVLSSAK